jgi:hypothetical protein
MNTLYKIYNKDVISGEEFLAYVGRTKNNLTQRLRNHFKGHPLQKKLYISKTTKIEYAEFATVADMYVMEILLINTLKPPYNIDDKANDNLTLEFTLPDVEWKLFNKPELFQSWLEAEKKEDWDNRWDIKMQRRRDRTC